MTLDEAIKALLDEYHLEDRAEDARDYIWGEEQELPDEQRFKGNRWDHPYVVRFYEICDVLKAHIRRVDKPTKK